MKKKKKCDKILKKSTYCTKIYQKTPKKWKKWINLKIQNQILRKDGHKNTKKFLRLYPLQGPPDSC